MAAKKVGTLIKEARTEAGLTQEQLAKKVKNGVTASDISKVERGEKDFTQAILKEIAKATGVTQSSLINAPKNTTAKKEPASSSSSSSSKKKTSSTTSMKVSSTEKKLVELYRDADSDTQKKVMELLKEAAEEEDDEDNGNILSSLLGGLSSGKKDDLLGTILNGATSLLSVKGNMPAGGEDGSSDEE